MLTRLVRAMSPVASRFASFRPLGALVLLVCTLSGTPLPPVFAAEGPSGLPLPRFATTRSTPLNVRVGPGTRYELAWVYLKEGVPVEIVQEFDTWRKIRDRDGVEGWVHQNLLSGRRAGYVAPWSSDQQYAVRASQSEDGRINAFLGPGFRVDIERCDGRWCAVSATDAPPEGRPATYTGYLEQSVIWGVYQDEIFD